MAPTPPFRQEFSFRAPSIERNRRVGVLPPPLGFAVFAVGVEPPPYNAKRKFTEKGVYFQFRFILYTDVENWGNFPNSPFWRG